MHRIVESICSLAQHVITVGADPQHYRPSACPHCRHARLWCHGCYHRKADRGSQGAGAAGGSLNPVAVLRFLCTACVRTCSRLPACIAPRRWYDWAVQQAVLLMVLTGASVHACARASGRDRHTVRRWREWLRRCDQEFSFVLRSRQPELGRCADFESFWRNVIDTLSLQQAMAWLDRDLTVP
jgi:transposase-like protein